MEFVGSTIDVGFSTGNLYELDFLLLRLYANHRNQLTTEEKQAVVQLINVLKNIRTDAHKKERETNTSYKLPLLPLRTAGIAKELKYDDHDLNLCTGWYRK